jgi:ATP-dependent helicase/nuclease subunit A
VSAWVGASAGTGKTKVLTDRILRLLLSGAAPERLLCLTFTKAAAAEMANRLHKRLAAWATADEAGLAEDLTGLEGRAPDEARRDAARRLFARVLDTPGGMRIQTIHSFCQSLLTRFPIEAGVPPHFAVADEATSQELLTRVLKETLAAADGDRPLAAAIAEVARHVREDAFLALLRELLGRRGRLARMTEEAGGPDALLARIARVLGVAEDATEASVLAEGCRPAAFDEPGLRQAARALAAGSDKEAERGRLIQDWLDAPETRPGTFPTYCRAFLTKTGTVLARLVNKGTLAAYPEAEAALRREAERLLGLQDRARAATVRTATAALLRLGQAILVRYERAKAQRSMLDYEDLILRTRALFALPGVAPWVLYKLDGGIDHVLVDEAQDTSPDQWSIVAALAEEFYAGLGARDEARTLFAVGDVKQSIYSFQGADPDAFRRMRAHFQERAEAADTPWRSVELKVSFRSTAAVLTAVDTVFAAAGARDGLADPARGDPAVIEHLVHRKEVPGRVEVWPLLAPAEAEEETAWSPPVEQRFAVSPPARLARRIARVVRGWLDDGELLEGEKETRPIRPGDVMVLVRRRTAFAAQMVRAFKDAGVPVAGIDRMVLPQQIAVMDLAALGRFALLPEDDLNLAALLKSPLVGLDEDALFALAHGRGERSLWSTLRRRRQERADFAAAHAYLAERLARADYVTPFAFFAETLGPGRGRRRLLDRLGPDAADPIDEFLSRTLAHERAHAPSLQGFLQWLDIQATEVRREMEARADAVRVMTVHGSKGLESQIVFLPDTAQIPRDGATLLWGDEPGAAGAGAGLVLWPTRRGSEEGVCRALREAGEHRQLQEYRRLLYVAMTRARDRLYVCGWRGSKEPPAENWHALVDGALRAAGMGDEVADGGGPEDGKVWRFDVAPEEGTAVPPPGPPRPAAAAYRDPAWLFAPPPPEPSPSRPLAPSRPEEEEPAPRSPVGADGGMRFRRGLVLHRLLQTLPDLPPDERAGACARFLALPAHRLDPATQAAWAEEALAVLDHPAARQLFAAPGRAEVPIVGRVGRNAISGTIDRLVVLPEEVVVLDYKTNRPPPSVEADTPPLYLRQMAAYRDAVRAVYPSRRVRCAILWTDGPHLMWLSEETLGRATAAATPP